MAARCRCPSVPAAAVPIASIGMFCRSIPTLRKAISPSRSDSKGRDLPMDGPGVEGALIATRAVHFAATTITAGTLVFRTVIAAPVLRTEGGVADVFRAQTQRVLWASLLV